MRGILLEQDESEDGVPKRRSIYPPRKRRTMCVGYLLPDVHFEGVPQRSYLDRPKPTQEETDATKETAAPRTYLKKTKRPLEPSPVPPAKRPPSPSTLVMRKPVDTLQDIVDGLRESGKLTPLLCSLLEKVCSSTSQDEMELILRDYRVYNAKTAVTTAGYPIALRSFALTLLCFSTEAYEDVQKLYEVALPPVPIARDWMSNTTCGPGFPGVVYDNLRDRAAVTDGGKLMCTLIVDDMSIRKEISHDGRNVRGYIDFGTSVEDDSLPAARNVLVFMAVGLELDWKAPCAYFFVDALSDKDLASLIRLCISKLHDAHTQVLSVTFGGPTFNAGLLRELGANPSPDAMQPWFPHPECPQSSVHIAFDARQMHALIKTSLALLHRLCDSTASEIRWNYVMELHRAQAFVYPPGHKFSGVDWDAMGMRIRLSEPTLGPNFANGIEFCGRSLQMSQFRGCEATIRFIKTFDQLTKTLRSAHVGEVKVQALDDNGSPRRETAEGMWRLFLEDCKAYISNLTNTKGIPLTSTNRKTPYLAFLMTIESVLSMCSPLLLEEDCPPLRHLLNGCMNQDHAEQLFAAVRRAVRRERLNVTEFRTAIKKVLAFNEGAEKRGKKKPVRRGVLFALQKFCERYKLTTAAS
ncbi:hypothetical protein V5799_018347 [Amblyomma americanum]|uniref:Uncharacterized protein n=1 Tax=Amblyomma americanum TaxID=6943 RepID=A0AAQ4F050_AMBAM